MKNDALGGSAARLKPKAIAQCAPIRSEPHAFRREMYAHRPVLPILQSPLKPSILCFFSNDHNVGGPPSFHLNSQALPEDVSSVPLYFWRTTQRSCSDELLELHSSCARCTTPVNKLPVPLRGQPRSKIYSPRRGASLQTCNGSAIRTDR